MFFFSNLSPYSNMLPFKTDLKNSCENYLYDFLNVIRKVIIFYKHINFVCFIVKINLITLPKNR